MDLDGPHELYDLVSDPLEAHNVIDEASHRGRVESLRMDLESWFKRYVDPRLDGAQSNVTGRGQIGLAGSAQYDKPFADDLVFFSDRE